MLDTYLFSREEITQLREDPFFVHLLPLFKKFGTVYDDGSIKVNLRKPVMPDPLKTKWDKLPFNHNDCLVDLVWDLFLKHGESYKVGVLVFDTLRIHIPCVKFSEEEKELIKSALGYYRSDYEGCSQFEYKHIEMMDQIIRKMGIS